jgi:hypothetical protein
LAILEVSSSLRSQKYVCTGSVFLDQEPFRPGLPCLADPQTGQVPSATTLLPSFPLPPSFASKSNTRGSYKLQILPVPTSVYNFSSFNFFFPHHTLVTHFPRNNALPASHLSFQAHCNNYVFLCSHSFCSIVQDPQSRPWFLT